MNDKIICSLNDWCWGHSYNYRPTNHDLGTRPAQLKLNKIYHKLIGIGYLHSPLEVIFRRIELLIHRRKLFAPPKCTKICASSCLTASRAQLQVSGTSRVLRCTCPNSYRISSHLSSVSVVLYIVWTWTTMTLVVAVTVLLLTVTNLNQRFVLFA